MQRAIHCVCCSIATGMLASTDGLPGPVTVDALMRPASGMVPLTLEALEAGNVGDVCRGQTPDRGDEETCRVAAASPGADGPEICAVVKRSRGNAAVEAYAASQIEPVGDMLKITPDLGSLGIALAPVPLLHQIRVERIAVGVAFGIAPGARIAIPVPCASDPGSGFQHPDGKTELVAELMQEIKAGGTGGG